jgi:hypothetical protein
VTDVFWSKTDISKLNGIDGIGRGEREEEE